MTRYGEIPDFVLENATTRLTAHKPAHLSCAGHGGTCPEPARHACARWGGAYCPGCWAELPRTVAAIDPALTLDGLRAARGMALDQREDTPA